MPQIFTQVFDPQAVAEFDMFNVVLENGRDLWTVEHRFFSRKQVGKANDSNKPNAKATKSRDDIEQRCYRVACLRLDYELAAYVDELLQSVGVQLEDSIFDEGE